MSDRTYLTYRSRGYRVKAWSASRAFAGSPGLFRRLARSNPRLIPPKSTRASGNLIDSKKIL